MILIVICIPIVGVRFVGVDVRCFRGEIKRFSMVGINGSSWIWKFGMANIHRLGEFELFFFLGN